MCYKVQQYTCPTQVVLMIYLGPLMYGGSPSYNTLQGRVPGTTKTRNQRLLLSASPYHCAAASRIAARQEQGRQRPSNSSSTTPSPSGKPLHIRSFVAIILRCILCMCRSAAAYISHINFLFFQAPQLQAPFLLFYPPTLVMELDKAILCIFLHPSNNILPSILIFCTILHIIL